MSTDLLPGGKTEAPPVFSHRSVSAFAHSDSREYLSSITPYLKESAGWRVSAAEARRHGLDDFRGRALGAPGGHRRGARDAWAPRKRDRMRAAEARWCRSGTTTIRSGANRAASESRTRRFRWNGGAVGGSWFHWRSQLPRRRSFLVIDARNGGAARRAARRLLQTVSVFPDMLLVLNHPCGMSSAARNARLALGRLLAAHGAGFTLEFNADPLVRETRNARNGRAADFR